MASLAGKELFAQLMRRPDDEIDLAQAALLIAGEEYPELDRDLYLVRLDELGRAARSRLRSGMEPREIVETLAGLLGHDEGFHGDEEDYYDARNSFLNDVLDRRTGIPITLSMVYIEVGRRAGLNVQGVGFPMHFLAKYIAPDGQEVLFDPFERGRIRSAEDCRNWLSDISGGSLVFRARYLAAAPARQIVTRMLNNLKQIYLRANYYRKAIGIMDRLLLVEPAAYEELRDRGAVHAELKNFVQAKADYERYLQHCSGREEVFAVRQAIQDIDEVLMLMDG